MEEEKRRKKNGVGSPSASKTARTLRHTPKFRGTNGTALFKRKKRESEITKHWEREKSKNLRYINAALSFRAQQTSRCGFRRKKTRVLGKREGGKEKSKNGLTPKREQERTNLLGGEPERLRKRRRCKSAKKARRGERKTHINSSLSRGRSVAVQSLKSERSEQCATRTRHPMIRE